MKKLPQIDTQVGIFEISKGGQKRQLDTFNGSSFYTLPRRGEIVALARHDSYAYEVLQVVHRPPPLIMMFVKLVGLEREVWSNLLK